MLADGEDGSVETMMHVANVVSKRHSFAPLISEGHKGNIVGFGHIYADSSISRLDECEAAH